MKYQFEWWKEIKKCEECPFSRYEYDEKAIYHCLWTHELVDDRPLSCPLKEVESKEPCEYCKEKYIIKDFYLEVYVKDNKLIAVGTENYDTAVIHYCPMCGRELGEI